MPPERLQKLIARAGIASRRAAEQLILDGEVTVNGRVVLELGSKADPASDHIKVRGKLLLFTTSPVYVMLNKPAGYVTTMKDPQGRPTVVDLLRGIRGRVFPVGRLDFDTEGLLLFTNDGALARELMHPSRRVPKIYAAKVTGKLTDEEIAKLEAGGMVLETGRTAPCRVRRVRESGQSSWVEVTLHEGKKRQVRLMLERLGHPVSKLIRTQYAGLVLGELSLGKSRLLTAAEVRRLQVAAQGRPEAPPASGAAPARRPPVRTAAPVPGRRVRGRLLVPFNKKAVRR
ncbi:MAG: hypothetical protein A2638_00005 [Nitrospirae bacterium RIFCSPHIGHO2_01_FULL_66_17]|nr:MAG: hypothetical protein A2638_00005 [Nitrospirae bacterium RIFCSPHIGHO2_01_FULL_66_17]